MDEVLELSYKKPEKLKRVACTLCGMDSPVMYRYKKNGVNGRLCYNCYHGKRAEMWPK